MAAAGNSYSRFIRFTKLVLPLLALGLLSTMFLFSRNFDPEAAIPFADIDVEKIAREQILARPQFSGVTSDGAEIMVTAASARPDLSDSRKLSAEEVRAEVTMPNSRIYALSAGAALYDGAADTLTLTSDVRVETSDGYRIETEGLVAQLGTTGFHSTAAVVAARNTSRLDAGRMELRLVEGRELLVFKDQVKLVYVPEE